jgi:catechol 2,3-dioxygenase-like lactoylglutathione lyase family enzyme
MRSKILIGSSSELGDQLVVEVMVQNLDRSLAFYTALGFKLERRDGDFAALRWEDREFFLDQRSDLAPSSGRRERMFAFSLVMSMQSGRPCRHSVYPWSARSETVITG